MRIAQTGCRRLRQVKLKTTSVRLNRIRHHAIRPRRTNLLTLINRRRFNFFQRQRLHVTTLPNLTLTSRTAITIRRFRTSVIRHLTTFRNLDRRIRTILMTIRQRPSITRNRRNHQLQMIMDTQNTRCYRMRTQLLRKLRTNSQRRRNFTNITHQIRIGTTTVSRLNRKRRFAKFVTLRTIITPPLNGRHQRQFKFSPRRFSISLISVRNGRQRTFNRTHKRRATATNGPSDHLRITNFRTTSMFTDRLNIVSHRRSNVRHRRRLTLQLGIARTRFRRIIKRLPNTVSLTTFTISRIRLIDRFLLKIRKRQRTRQRNTNAIRLSFQSVRRTRLSTNMALLRHHRILPNIHLNNTSHNHQYKANQKLTENQ